jgi:hypothetical protein
MATAKKPASKTKAPVKKTATKVEKPVVAEQPKQLNDLQRQAVKNQLSSLRQGFKAKVTPEAEEKKVRPTCVEFKVTLSDGTVLLARGEHADVILRFSDECQSICIQNGMAVYTGPPLKKFTAEEWAAEQAV